MVRLLEKYNNLVFIGISKVKIFHLMNLLVLFDVVVPMSVVASFKKIKALTSNHAYVAKILQCSTKLVSFSSFPPLTSIIPIRDGRGFI